MSTNYNMEKTGIFAMLRDIKALIKGIVLPANVLPILSGFWLALYFNNETFLANVDKFLLMTIGSTFVIAGALIINNWYEVDLDTEMDRTQERPTVTGNFTMKTILSLGIIATVIGHVVMFFTTFEAFIFTFIGWFTYVVLYTFWTKRRYTLNTVVGSVSGAVTPLIGWATISSTYHIVPIVLFMVLFIWQIPHTFAIAMRRYDDYKAAGVPMLPVAYGFAVTKRQNAVYIAALLPLPLFLTSLGYFFVIVMSILNVIWLWMAIKGIFQEDDRKYANSIFYFSLLYLTVVFGLMIFITL